MLHATWDLIFIGSSKSCYVSPNTVSCIAPITQIHRKSGTSPPQHTRTTKDVFTEFGNFYEAEIITNILGHATAYPILLTIPFQRLSRYLQSVAECLLQQNQKRYWYLYLFLLRVYRKQVEKENGCHLRGMWGLPFSALNISMYFTHFKEYVLWKSHWMKKKMRGFALPPCTLLRCRFLLLLFSGTHFLGAIRYRMYSTECNLNNWT